MSDSKTDEVGLLADRIANAHFNAKVFRFTKDEQRILVAALRSTPVRCDGDDPVAWAPRYEHGIDIAMTRKNKHVIERYIKESRGNAIPAALYATPPPPRSDAGSEDDCSCGGGRPLPNPSGEAMTKLVPKVRTSHHRNKEEAARLQALVAKRYERDTLLLAKRALEQAQDCILGKAPPDITRKRAREDTLNKIGKALLALASPSHTCGSQYVLRELPDPNCGACTWTWGDRLSDLPETGASSHPSANRGSAAE